MDAPIDASTSASDTVEVEYDEEGEHGPTADDALPTLPASFAVQIRGWENEDEARRFGEEISAWVYEFSKYRDLCRLQSVVIAWDYPEALANIDTGDAMPVAARTQNEYGQGGAMAVTLKQNDELWSSVVIWTPLVRELVDSNHPDHKLAVLTLAHELVHVEDQRIFESTYPGGWQSAKARDAREAEMQRIVNPCQSEYSAQRRSACFAPESGMELMDMLENAMRDVDEQITKARRAYRWHGDVERFWETARERLAFLFQAIGYAIGHADYIANDGAISADLAQQFKNKEQRIAELPQGWLLDACRDAVQPFFSLQEWRDMSIYDELEKVLERLLNLYGVYTSVRSERLYLDMPYSCLAEL